MKEGKSHIILVCSRLDLPGGTERATVNLAGLLAENGHAVTLLVLDVTGDSFYTLHKDVKLVHRDLHFGITPKGNVFSRKLDLYRHIRTLQQLFQLLKPDVVIGTEYYLSIVCRMASSDNRIKVFAWEHHHIHWLEKNRFWTFLFKRYYPKMDYVVCQNSTEKRLFEEMGCRSIVIPYVLPQQQPPQATLETRQILTIGWLIKRKGVDMIPAIAEKIVAMHPDWHWKIIGKGEEYESLRQQIADRQLENFLTIQKPVSQDLQREYLATSLYVMTSGFECLPLVLLEATSFGIPCIAFDCPTGPADIVHHGADGWIVPLEDVQAMASAILELIADEKKRKEMGRAAAVSSMRYHPERVYGLWSKVL